MTAPDPTSTSCPRMGFGFACVVGLLLLCFTGALRAQNVSPAPILQWFEGKYDTQRERTADLFLAGYGGTWIPPTGRADSGNQSVGYDVFDRFDLGTAKNKTLYGTADGLRGFTSIMHRAGNNVYADLIWNHNGFSDDRTPGFIEAGAYPGFVLEIPGLADGDFHDLAETGEENFRLAGLIDINQSLNIQLIRHPVDANNPQNIPAGTLRNLPDPNNARFYPDRANGGTVVFDPAFNQNVTLYDFNAANPLAGDAVTENATGLLMRNVRWMIQDVGVDGFRLDAGRHFPRWVLNFFDQATFRASQRTHLDGSPRHAFSFTEVGFDSAAFQQDFIRKDIDLNNLGQLGGNRDALDFNFFGAVNGNLQNTGVGNNWHNVVNASIDLNDNGFMDGSQGVKFVESHDDFGPGMINVAYAYMLMLPGNANVYYNAQQNYHPLRAFPKDGRGDALGNFGDTRTDLVDIRSRYGRGNFIPRFIENQNYAYEREKSALVLLSNRNDAGFDPRTIATNFNPGTWLVELTGNAANNADIPEFLEVQSNGSVNARFLRNDGQDKGYLIYGPKTPQSTNGIELLNTGGVVLAGDTPPDITGNETSTELGNKLRENGGARLADLHVITTGLFTVRLATQAVTLNVPGIPGGVRDTHADGDQALLRINEGHDLNGSGFIDNTSPDDLSYGFENFVTVNNQGFNSATGDGLYEQIISTNQLPEGMNFLTVRAFRHRNPGTGGDDGPAVFTEYKKVLWVDLLPPEVAFESQTLFSPVSAGIDFAFRNADDTADEVFLLRNVGAALDDTTILASIGGGTKAANLGSGLFERSYSGVDNGNHAFTVVTFERTGNFSIQRRWPGPGRHQRQRRHRRHRPPERRHQLRLRPQQPRHHLRPRRRHQRRRTRRCPRPPRARRRLRRPHRPARHRRRLPPGPPRPRKPGRTRHTRQPRHRHPLQRPRHHRRHLAARPQRRRRHRPGRHRLPRPRLPPHRLRRRQPRRLHRPRRPRRRPTELGRYQRRLGTRRLQRQRPDRTRRPRRRPPELGLPRRAVLRPQPRPGPRTHLRRPPDPHRRHAPTTPVK